jgi:transcriptional regulator with XRE-family HTH domain
MDLQIDLEQLRARLRAMKRPEVLQLALKAGVPHSTVEKFRNGHTDEPRLSKLRALTAALGTPRRKSRKTTA